MPGGRSVHPPRLPERLEGLSAGPRVLLLALCWAFLAPAQAPAAAPEAKEEKSLDLAGVLGSMTDAAWKDRPEWGNMMVAILKGEMLKKGKAWWSPGKMRLGWPWLAQHFDRNSDEKIERAEFPLDDLLFERLDRNRDGVLRAADLEPPEDSRFPGLSDVFSRLDRDSNGRISLEEITEFFHQADSGGLGFLSREDIRRALFESADEGGGGGDDRPSPWIMLHMLLTRQLGSLTEGPRLGEMAPDFRLPSHEGKRVVALSDSRGKKPVVLIFGSFT
jgi:hypothetical protein